MEAEGGRVAVFSFERFGEGSDKDHSFEAGRFYTGTMYLAPKDAYNALFGRKGLLNSFYGLADMNKEAIAKSRERGTDKTSNIAGDGFQLGGAFVVDVGGSVLLEHRQGHYGDDESNEGLLAALRSRRSGGQVGSAG